MAALSLQCQARCRLLRRRQLQGVSSGSVSAEMAAGVDRAVQAHQRAGIRWLYKALQRGGGILGDDPGLGKTLQVIGLLSAVVRRGLATRVLVVVPAHLLKNWGVEFKNQKVARQWRRCSRVIRSPGSEFRYPRISARENPSPRISARENP